MTEPSPRLSLEEAHTPGCPRERTPRILPPKQPQEFLQGLRLYQL